MTDAVAPFDWHFSPSQVDTFLSCPRKWAWRYIAGLRTPSAKSAELGTRTHTVLEDYIRDGTMPPVSHPDPEIREAAQIAFPALEHLPPRGDHMQSEREFRFAVPYASEAPIKFLGRVDVTVNSAGWCDVPCILDFKTSSDIKRYGKTEETLKEDPQAIIYAANAMAEFKSPVVEMRWLYLATRGGRRCEPKKLRLHEDHVKPRFDALLPVLSDLRASLEVKRDPRTFPGDESHCNAFRGCPYKAQCAPLMPTKNPFQR